MSLAGAGRSPRIIAEGIRRQAHPNPQQAKRKFCAESRSRDDVPCGCRAEPAKLLPKGNSRRRRTRTPQSKPERLAPLPKGNPRRKANPNPQQAKRKFCAESRSRDDVPCGRRAEPAKLLPKAFVARRTRTPQSTPNLPGAPFPSGLLAPPLLPPHPSSFGGLYSFLTVYTVYTAYYFYFCS